MENKKLLKYLLNDLSELEEMFAEKGKNSFDEFETEFIQNRISGSIRLVKLFLEKENSLPANLEPGVAALKKEEQPVNESLINNLEISTEEIVRENKAVNNPGVWIEEKAPEAITREIEEKVVVIENNITAPEIITEEEEKTEEQIITETDKQNVQPHEEPVQNELRLEEEEQVEIHHKRLGDSFSKEKSVNDIMSDDMSKLEHKLSNRPVLSIQSAIGINDRFQFIRELFEGNADNFVKAVTELDSMNDMKEAVEYMQANFKWKKNDASLKFVNLVKRRFPNG
ncbi:MAG TPA: hypothetical protein P5210_11475 [Draconibacterium sp.]|nr:hypothetical protein [Draconibacterium sp.]HRX12265.1 hypothetical protein [Draconibacterium sp.]